MSEIKDNKDIEEVKESEARYNKPCNQTIYAAHAKMAQRL